MVKFELMIDFPVRKADGSWLSATCKVGSDTDKPNQSVHGYARRLAQDMVERDKGIVVYIVKTWFENNHEVSDAIERWRWCSRTYGPVNTWAKEAV